MGVMNKKEKDSNLEMQKVGQKDYPEVSLGMAQCHLRDRL